MACQYFVPCEHGAKSFTIDIPKVTFGRGVLTEVGERAEALSMKILSCLLMYTWKMAFV